MRKREREGAVGRREREGEMRRKERVRGKERR